jgi:hypothetical protein
MPSTMSLQGHVFNDAGTALQDVEVKVFKKNTTATALATDTSDANGRWDLSWSTSGDTDATQVDVQGTSGTSVFRWKYDDRIAVSGAFIKDLHIIPESDFAFKFEGAPTANRTITFQNSAGTVALLEAAQTFTLAQTFSGLITANGGITFAAGDDIAFTGTTGTNDITLTNSLADALSITRAGTDMMVFNSAAPSITFTPATTFSGGITNAGTIAAGTWNGTAIASGYIAADAITGAKIADDAIDSEHYTDGSIDAAHLAADVVTGAKIADDAIDSEHYTDGSIDNAHIADDAIDSEHYADGSIDNAHIADDAIDSEHYAAASIDFAHIQDVAANSILGRNANSSGVLSEVALATTQILIGDGTGFTPAALSGDATMTNAGVVSIGSGVIVNADINASAAIAISKTALTAGTNISLSTNTLNVDDAFLKNNASDATTGTVTMAHLIVGDAGNIGSASDGDAIAISSAGVVTFSQAVDIQGGYANGGGAPYDGVVDAGGGGNWTTIQAGDDALDGGTYTMLVKAGTYAENVVVSTNDVHIVVEPGTDIQGSVTLSGANIKLSLGPNCDLDGIIVSGNDCVVDGGGWSTIVDGTTANHGIEITGSRVIVQNIATKTTAGDSTSFDAVSISGSGGGFILRSVRIVDSDRRAIDYSVTDGLIEGCLISGADAQGIIAHDTTASSSCRIIGNRITATASQAILLQGAGDNTVIVGNEIQAVVGVSVEIGGDAENCVVVGNRLDGAVTDSSGTSTVASNDAATY